jgi:two-component system, chemotaxis family, protein-glutamate methylesterase/glutaminase
VRPLRPEQLQSGRLVAVGVPLGGVAALSAFLEDLPANFPASILVVLHTGSHASQLPEILRSKGVLAAGRIYIAPPDRRLIVEADRLRVTASYADRSGVATKLRI